MCLIIDFYFKPIFIQLPERICLFICLYLLKLWEDFFCRTAMQKRSEEAVFFYKFRGTRYPGTQVPRWKWRKWIPLRCLRHTTSRRRSSLCLFTAQIQIEALAFFFVFFRFYEIVGSLCTEGSSSKAWMLSVKGSFR